MKRGKNSKSNSHFEFLSNRNLLNSKRSNSHSEFLFNKNIVNSKCSQSGIIAVVLILVIVISAIAILWSAVKKNVEKSEEIDIEILAADLKIEKSRIFINETSEKLQLSVKRGSDNAKLSSLKIVVLNGGQERYTTADIPSSLESKTYVLNISSLNNIKEILVYPVSEKGMIGIGEKYEVRGDEPKEIEDLAVINPDNKIDCVINWQCEEWSECQAVYDLNNILGEEVILNGEQTRNCEDINNCLEKAIEIKECNPKVSVNIKKVEKCDKEYLEIYDLQEVLISRLELIEGRLNIQFPLDKYEYFPYCYNAMQDCDETGVDCGGSCSSC